MPVKPTWDLLITIFMVMGVAYGFIMQREKILATLLSVYVSFAVATVWGQPLFAILTGKTIVLNQLWFKSDLTLFHVQTGIFVVLIVLLSLKGDFADITRRVGGSSNPLIVFAYSFLNAGLVLTILFNFMGVRAVNYLAKSSHLAGLIIHYKIWWIILPALAMIAAGFFRGVEVTPPQTERR